MPVDKELEFEAINWDKVGEYTEITPEGVIVRDNRGAGEVIAIKRVELGQNTEELNNEIKEIVRDRCVRMHREELTYYSEVYEREMLAGPYLPPNIYRNNQLIARAYYGQPLIIMSRRLEEAARKNYPMGYNVCKKLICGDENAIGALREYTRKVLGGKVDYRFVGENGVELYHPYFKDLPEEVFKNQLAKISQGGWTERDLQFLPSRVERAFPEEKKKKKRIVEANTVEHKERHAGDEIYNPFDGYELIQQCDYVESVMKEILTNPEIEAMILVHKEDLGPAGAAKKLGRARQSIADREKSALKKLHEYFRNREF